MQTEKYKKIDENQKAINGLKEGINREMSIQSFRLNVNTTTTEKNHLNQRDDRNTVFIHWQSSKKNSL